eukprot:sb/3468632/
MNETTSNTFGIAFYTFLKLFVTKVQHLHGFPKTKTVQFPRYVQKIRTFCLVVWTQEFFSRCTSDIITPTCSRLLGRSRGGVISLPRFFQCWGCAPDPPRAMGHLSVYCAIIHLDLLQLLLVLALLGFFVPMGCTPILLIMIEVYKVRNGGHMSISASNTIVSLYCSCFPLGAVIGSFSAGIVSLYAPFELSTGVLGIIFLLEVCTYITISDTGHWGKLQFITFLDVVKNCSVGTRFTGRKNVPRFKKLTLLIS